MILEDFIKMLTPKSYKNAKNSATPQKCNVAPFTPLPYRQIHISRYCYQKSLVPRFSHDICVSINNIILQYTLRINNLYFYIHKSLYDSMSTYRTDGACVSIRKGRVRPVDTETCTEYPTDRHIRIIIIYKITDGDSSSLARRIRDNRQRSSAALIK